MTKRVQVYFFSHSSNLIIKFVSPEELDDQSRFFESVLACLKVNGDAQSPRLSSMTMLSLVHKTLCSRNISVYCPRSTALMSTS
jgi:hypothetical protein